MIRKNVFIIGFILFIVVMSSCWHRPETYFKFYIPEVNMYVTTFKRPGKFYLLMSPTKYETSLSDSVDYIEFRIGAYANIILDSLDSRNIYIQDYYGKKKPQIHKNNYNINLVESYFFLEQYFEKHRPKQRYVLISLSTDVYGISVGGKTIKEENLWGD